MTKIWRAFLLFTVLVMGIIAAVLPSHPVRANVSGITVNPYTSNFISTTTGYQVIMTSGAVLDNLQSITIRFPSDTTMPSGEGLNKTNYTINSIPCTTNTTVSSYDLTVYLPGGISPGVPFNITINPNAGMKNPSNSSNSGTNLYRVEVWTSIEAAHVNSNTYTINGVDVYQSDGITWKDSYTTVQAAINGATAGDIIRVPAKTYPESVVIDRGLTLQGASGAIIAPATGIGIQINSSPALTPVTVTGFTITPQGSTLDSAQGIVIGSVGTPVATYGITISNNTITTLGQNMGILVRGVGSNGAGYPNSSNLTVSSNNITLNGDSTAFYASWVTPAHANWTITGNTFDSPIGVNLELSDVNGANVSNNIFKIAGSGGSGSVFIGAELCNLTSPIVFNNNDVQGNGAGTMVAFINNMPGKTTGPTTMDNVTINGNTFSNWAAAGRALGIFPRVTTVIIHQNNFTFMSGGTGLRNTSGVPIDATDNYWGSANGPTHAKNVFNAGSQGVLVSDDVNYVRWRTTAGGTLLNGPISNSTSYYSCFVDAIAATTAGGIITAMQGSYTEDFKLNKALTLRGAEHAINPAAMGSGWIGNTIIKTSSGTGTGKPDYAGYSPHIKSSNVTFQGFKVTSATTAQPGFYIGGESAVCDNIRIENCEMTGMSEAGIIVSALDINANLTNVVINQVYSHDNSAGNGIKTVNVNNPTISNCRITDNGATGSADQNKYGVWVGATISAKPIPSTITGNTFSGNNFGSIIIKQHSGSGQTVNGTVINKNNFNDASTKYGITNTFADTNINGKINWWNNSSGPSHDAITYGSLVSNYVIYQPWLIAAYTTQAPVTDLAITSATALPAGGATVPYSTTLAANGGSGTYTWQTTPYSGTLSGDLGLATTGVISGTPAAPSTSSFAAQVRDGVQGTYKDFTLQIYSSALSITSSSLPGGTVGTAYNQTLQATGGTGAYTWAINSGSLPTGLTINAANGAITGTPTVAGTYSFEARVVSNGQAAFKAFIVVITPPAPSAPVLISPANGTIVGGTAINFQWNMSTGATGYWLSVTKASDGSPVISQYMGNVTSHNQTGFPNNGTQYRWAVAAGNSTGWSSGTSATFVNGPASIPLPPVLISPINGASASGTITFQWNASTNATGYWLTITRSSDGFTVISQYVGNVTSYSQAGFLSNGTQYTWAVAAGNSLGWSSGASATFVSGTASIPLAPVLSSPANASTVPGTSINFQWNASGGATGYWLSVARVSDGSTVISQYMGNVTSHNQTGFPNDGTQYRWAVAAGNGTGWSSGTSATFINGPVSIPLAPVLSLPANASTVAGISINFQWVASSGATGYWLTVARVSDGSTVISQYVGNVTSYSVGGFPNNYTQYRWAVAAGNSTGWSSGTSATFTNGP